MILSTSISQHYQPTKPATLGRVGSDMDKFSLSPDEHMRWIYDIYHKDYHSEHANYLRESRAAALRNAPRWMIEQASANDFDRKNT